MAKNLLAIFLIGKENRNKVTFIFCRLGILTFFYRLVISIFFNQIFFTEHTF